MPSNMLDVLYGAGGTSDIVNNLTQFSLAPVEVPSRDSVGVYAEPVNPATHAGSAQSSASVSNRLGSLTNNLHNPLGSAESLHLVVLIFGVLAGLIVLRHVFKGAVI
jgi:hypothetical protein